MQQWSCRQGHVLFSVWGHCAVAGHDGLCNARIISGSPNIFTTDVVVVGEELVSEV